MRLAAGGLKSNTVLDLGGVARAFNHLGDESRKKEPPPSRGRQPNPFDPSRAGLA